MTPEPDGLIRRIGNNEQLFTLMGCITGDDVQSDSFLSLDPPFHMETESTL
jgi:hypothetical protein